MNLISMTFGVFFLATLLLYYLVPQKFRWLVLFTASILFFLLAAEPYTILYFAGSSLVVFFAGKYFAKTRQAVEQPGTEDAHGTAKLIKKRKCVFVSALLFCIVLLAFFKYINPMLYNMQMVLSVVGVDFSVQPISWVAPLGISFYTLQIISYLADVYWGTADGQQNGFKFLLFAGYFPQMISGPISRYEQLQGQLYAGNRFSYETIAFGMQRILWGLFKKLLIADRLAFFVNDVFRAPNDYSGLYIWVAGVVCAVQVYADFSGNMDVIMGVSECFGIRLPENFRQPFFSRTIQEFWQRWHITLGTWLRDYVMYPLLNSNLWARMSHALKKKFGKKAAKTVPVFLAMFILWMVNGVWHGGSWKFMAVVLWFWFSVTMGQLLTPLF